MMQRYQALITWTQASLSDSDCYLKPASSDASFRSYYRAFSKGQTYIIMDAPPEHEDCLSFIDISNRLIEAGLNVPKILNKNLEDGFLLISDLGNKHYLDLLNENNYQLYYLDAIEALKRIQTNASADGLKAYNVDLLTIELGLFDTWFIQKHLGFTLNEGNLNHLENTKSILINNALEQPQVFVHRDFHSRNLMTSKSNNPGIIDYQDAVIGPITYDLVSLLRDCYIKCNECFMYEQLDSFRIYANEKHNHNHNFASWERWFDLMGMQRHMKAIGIFCRLNYRDNKPDYLKDIPLTLSYLKRMSDKYSEFNDFSQLLEEISPNMDDLCKP